MTNLPTLVNGYILASADCPAVLSEKEKARLCEGMDHQSKLFTSVSSPALRIGTINVSCFLIDRSFIGDQRQLGGRQFRFAAPTIVVDIHLIAPVNWCWHGENLGPYPVVTSISSAPLFFSTVLPYQACSPSGVTTWRSRSVLSVSHERTSRKRARIVPVPGVE